MNPSECGSDIIVKDNPMAIIIVSPYDTASQCCRTLLTPRLESRDQAKVFHLGISRRRICEKNDERAPDSRL